MEIKAFFDSATFTLSYVVWDSSTLDAIVIDSVLNFDAPSGEWNSTSVNELTKFINDNKLVLHFILDTHAHADHISGCQLLKKNFPKAQLAIGQGIIEVQKVFKEVFNLDKLCADGSQWDRLLQDGETFSAGSLSIEVLSTPGHTPACVTYLVNGKAAFTGDAMFMPDYGTGRCDFPKGDARTLYHSIHERLYGLPDETRVFVGHDYQPGGRELLWETSIGDAKKSNIHLKAGTSEAEFVKFRTDRDGQLSAPKLLLPSIQLNIDAGQIPAPESNGTVYLKLPFKERV